ncbi:unnamed protein product [Hymenolepis diminuta]|uniref:Uncharacterized protein n=1 Tax=Hymenolepis diminuta TaxID=6216 RepID=A0A564YA29_HYMDI|nr:unnamed protein product [Hymenolepis diminuta]
MKSKVLMSHRILWTKRKKAGQLEIVIVMMMMTTIITVVVAVIPQMKRTCSLLL